jgi:DNA-binding CsgD family transcriptional regulator
MHHVSEDILKELLIDKGYTDNQAAVFLGISKSSVCRRRVLLGIKPKPKYSMKSCILSVDSQQKVRDYYLMGKNDYEVARLMHIGRNTLRAWRLENGISSQSNKKGLSKKDAEEMWRLYSGGSTTGKIATLYGINRTSVSKHLKKCGFKIESKRNISQ